MPRKKNGSQGIPYSPGDDPPANQFDLQAQIADIDRQIATHQQLLRGAATTVYQPLIDQALGRIQQQAHDLLVPAAAQPQTIKGLAVGAPVTVTMSPAVSGIVLRTQTDPATGKQQLVVLTRDKGIVVAAPEEVSAGLPSSEGPPTSISSAPGPLPSGPENPSSSSVGHSIHSGDMVQTPIAIGRVLREPVAGSDVYEVDLGPQGKFHFRRNELVVVPPPAPVST